MNSHTCTNTHTTSGVSAWRWWLGNSSHGSQSCWTGTAWDTAAWRGFCGISVPPHPHLSFQIHTPAHTYSIYPHIDTSSRSLTLQQQQHRANTLLLTPTVCNIFKCIRAEPGRGLWGGKSGSALHGMERERQGDPGLRWQLCYDLSARSWWMVGRMFTVSLYLSLSFSFSLSFSPSLNDLSVSRSVLFPILPCVV